MPAYSDEQLDSVIADGVKGMKPRFHQRIRFRHEVVECAVPVQARAHGPNVALLRSPRHMALSLAMFEEQAEVFAMSSRCAVYSAAGFNAVAIGGVLFCLFGTSRGLLAAAAELISSIGRLPQQVA